MFGKRWLQLKPYFGGSYDAKMRQLVRDGYLPLTVREVLAIRMQVLSMPEGDEKETLLHVWGVSLGTSDLVAHYGDTMKVIALPGVIRRILHEQNLRIKRGDYLVPPGLYQELPGAEISKLSHGEDFNPEESDLARQIWTLLGGEAALGDYRQLLSRNGFPSEMRVWLAANWARIERSYDMAIVRPWRLESMVGGSHIEAMYPVDGGSGLPPLRLLGKRSGG